MNLNSKITLTIRNFFKKYGKIIFIVILVWILVIILNTYLKNRPEELKASKTYNPDEPVINYGGKVPKKEKQEVNETLETYLTYCKNKDYQNAYNMLTTECKKFLYEDDIEQFKNYVNNVFNTSNDYSYNQNYSNVGDIYIYEVTILNNDILSTGTTGGYNKYQEKISIVKEDGVKKISNQGYIKNEKIGKVAEDDYMKVKIVSKDHNYSRVVYNLEITNKTDRILVVSDNKFSQEVTISLDGYTQNASNIMFQNAIINPGNTIKVQYAFDRFYDDSSEDTMLSFNYVRVLDNYKSEMLANEQEQKAEKLYSFNINLTK